MTSVPFSLPPERMMERVGLMRLDGDDLVLEIRRLSAFKKVKDQQEVRIPVAGLESAIVEKGWITTNVVLKARTLAALGPLEQEKPGRTEIGIARADVEAARRLCTQITSRLREIERAEADKELDGMNLSPQERELLK